MVPARSPQSLEKNQMICSPSAEQLNDVVKYPNETRPQTDNGSRASSQEDVNAIIKLVKNGMNNGGAGMSPFQMNANLSFARHESV